MDLAEKAFEPQLLQQAEKILLRPIHPHLMSYCPTMDLIALVTDEENLDVYRINGQRAFGLKRKSEDDSIDTICWQENGLAIAVSWSDGCTDVVSSETGKVVHRDVPPPLASEQSSPLEDAVRTRLIGWGTNFVDVESVKERTGFGDTNKEGTFWKKITDPSASTTLDWDALNDGTGLEDFLQRQPDYERLDVVPDLPDVLAMMDMEPLLARLPSIPMPPPNPFMRHMAADAGAFSSQAMVDGLLHSQHLRDHNSVYMFIRCTEKGTVHPSIYDSMETTDIRLPQAWGVQSAPIAHASHPFACTHGLLMTVARSGEDKKQIAYVPLSLRFIPSAGIYLHLIASKTSQLQNLVSYLTHSLTRIRTFFTHSQDLPGKFMRNINDTLAGNHQGDLVTNLFQLACTGYCPQSLHEWLVDELAEQGHKRWDNAVSTGMSTLIQLLHENFIPALDRCAIFISRLHGLAKYHEQAWVFTGPVSEFTALLNLLKNLRLLAFKTLLHATDERRQFASFSKWLRYCIDFEATEPGSQSRAEMETRDPGVDIAVVAEYIRYGLTSSDLKPYLKGEKEVGGSNEVASFEDTAKAIELLKKGATFKEEALSLEKVLGHFSDGVRRLLKQVSTWQMRNTSMNSGLVLEDGEVGDAVDMRMVYEPSDPSSISTYIALTTPTSPSTLHIHRLTHSPSFVTPPSLTYAPTSLDVSPSKILSAVFADDTSLLLLLETPSTSSDNEDPVYSLVSLPYTPTATSTSISTKASIGTPSTQTSPEKTALIQYVPVPATLLPSLSLPSGTPLSTSSTSSTSSTPTAQHRQNIPLPRTTLQEHTLHVFTGRFTPLKLIVNGRKGRRVVVVLGSDRKHYRVLDLDFTERARGLERGLEGRGGGFDGAADGGAAWESESEASIEDVDLGGAAVRIQGMSL